MHIEDSTDRTPTNPEEAETEENTDTLTFEADSFSVYAVVYTVDFHYEVDGRTYDFSIPGGGFVTLQQLVEVLGIANSETYSENESNNVGNSGDFSGEADENSAGEVNGINKGSIYLDIRISDETRQFVEDVESVEFSAPGMVWVGKTDSDSTVGGLKEANGLECRYSAELTEEQIGNINAQTVAGGDWALISMQPFTSEENLTVTMKNGEQFIVKVTDAQQVSDASTIDVNKTYIICYEDNSGFHVLKTDGTSETFASSQAFVNTGGGMDKLGSDYQWTFYYVFVEKDRETSMDYTYYFIRPAADKTKTIALNEAGENLIQTGTNNVAVIPQDGGGFVFLGYNHSEGTHIELGFQNGSFESFNHAVEADEPDLIRLFEQEPLDKYDFTVVSDNYVMGSVSTTGTTLVKQAEVEQLQPDGTYKIVTQNVNYYLAETNNVKKNNAAITATPGTHRNTQGQNKWAFDYWDLDGVKLEGAGPVIQPGTIEIPKNGSVLTAHFKQNSETDYVVPDKEKEGTSIESMTDWLEDLKSRNVPLNPAGTKKTAEVYDYENRIYRVDLTAQSSLTTFDGTIDMGFIIDVSGSMNFPSLLYESTQVTGVKDLSHINDRRWYNDQTLGQREWGLDTNHVYYIIADPSGTATVCYLYYYNNNWWLCDSSKDRYTGNGRFDPANGHSADNTQYYDQSYYTSTSYVIMEAGDRVTQEDFDDPETSVLLSKHNLQIGDPKTRAFYLEKSLNGTIKELNSILGVLSIANNNANAPDVKIAWNTFKNYLPDGTNQNQYSFLSAKYGINLNYDKNTYGGGTSTDIALLDAAGVKRSDVKENGNNTDSAPHSSNTSDYRDWYRTEDQYRYNYNKNTAYTDYSDSRNGFQWEQSASKYAVLITDGAPQRSGQSIYSGFVKDAAEQLTGKGVDLITVGLGMDNVTSGKILLYDIANTISNEKMFFSAKSGDELQDVLLQIVSKIMVDASVQGDVTDVISEAFYPVEKSSGKPLAADQMIDLEGNITEDASQPHGIITYDSENDTYGVKWVNQNFTWEGWQGSVYIKAKEDLLGANAAMTNAEDAVVEAKAYKTSENGPSIPLVDKKYIDNDPDKGEDPKYTRIAYRESPRVNINELSFLGNDTEWSVYLSTSVDPKTELRGLYDNIIVEEVIQKDKAEDRNGDGLPDTVKYSGSEEDNNWYPLAPDSIEDSREPDGRGERNTFYFKDLIRLIAENSEEGTYEWWDYANGDLDWDKFIEMALSETPKKDGEGNIITDGNGDPVMEVTGFNIPYQVYGIEDNSYIQISLKKEIVEGEEADLITKSPHDTTVIGDEVEKYTLTVVYYPDYDVLPKGQGGKSTEDFHVGIYGTIYQGHAAGTETSENTHIINVYVQTLDVEKTDDSGDPLPGAEFKLYRAAAENGISVEGLQGTYKEVASGTSSETDGIAHLTFVEGEYLLPDTAYYLVETEAPQHYKKADTVWTVKLQTDKGGVYTDLDGEELSTKIYPFNWEQGARILVDNNITKVIAKGETGQQTIEITDGSFVSYEKAISFRHTVENKVDTISFEAEKRWENVEEDPQNQITFELYRVSEKGHHYGPGRVVPCSCTEDGVKEYVCTECDHVERFVIDKTGHVEGTAHRENETEPDCETAGGYDTVVRCRVCDAIITSEHTEIEALGHTPGEPAEENRVEATCLTEGGYDTVTRCTRCNEILTSIHHTIPADFIAIGIIITTAELEKKRRPLNMI